jgi:mitogen-activated protein kinase kinase 1
MPQKEKVRPAPLISTPKGAEEVSITDTMTLVIRDSQGNEQRVRDSGYVPPPTSGRREDSPVECVMNRINFDDIRRGELLGTGSQGKVRKGVHKVTGQKYAIKEIGLGEDPHTTRQVLERELHQIAAIRHPNVVTSYDAFFREGKLLIVLEYMDCGTITTVIKKLGGGMPEDKVSYITRQLFAGLAHLHSYGVVHRDIKPGNILLNRKGEVKISDFGVAANVSINQLHHTAVGSTPYMSPERLQSQPYSFSSDIWSAGLVVAECAMGEYPFFEVKTKFFELCQKIVFQKASIDWQRIQGRTFSPEIQDFVNQCLQPASARPTPETLLMHPFLQLGANLDPLAVGEWFFDPLGSGVARSPLSSLQSDPSGSMGNSPQQQ